MLKIPTYYQRLAEIKEVASLKRTSIPNTARVAASRFRSTMAFLDFWSKLTTSSVSITHDTTTMRLKK